MKSVRLLIFADEKIATQIQKEMRGQRPDLDWDIQAVGSVKMALDDFRTRLPDLVILQSTLPETTPQQLAREFIRLSAATTIFCLKDSVEDLDFELEPFQWPPVSWSQSVYQLLSQLSIDKIERLGGLKHQSALFETVSSYAGKFKGKSEVGESFPGRRWIPAQNRVDTSLAEMKPELNGLVKSEVSHFDARTSSKEWMLLLVSTLLALGSWYASSQFESVFLSGVKWLVTLLVVTLWLGFFVTRLFLKLQKQHGPLSESMPQV